MNQIIYNSFPRSGNVYAGYVGSHIIWGNYATVHIPQIFGTKDLDMISIFRKPEDAISSLINKRMEKGQHKTITVKTIEQQSKTLCNEYKEYLNKAMQNHQSIHIVKFDNLISNPVKTLLDISDRFNRTLLKDYEESFNSLTFSGKLWEDQYDGHVPREKSETRLLIQDVVKSLDFIQDINKEYEEFIKEYKSC